MSSTAARDTGLAVLQVGAGVALIVLGIGASIHAQAWIIAAFAGAAGFEILRRSVIAKPVAPALLALDALAFTTFAYMRNDSMGFWQLPGPWADAPHFNIAGAAIAYAIYIVGSLVALLSARRGLRPIEAIGLIAIPFLFNLVMAMGADWHMQELGALVGAGALPFQGQVLVGRALIIFSCSEAMLIAFCLIGTGRVTTRLPTHGLLLGGAILAAMTPLLANAAQWVAQPAVAIVVSTILAALAQAGLWSIVYIMTGLTLDLLGGRPPTFVSTYGHWRTGFVKGAIYGAIFMFLLLAIALPLRQPGFVAFVKANALVLSPLAGALAYPLIQTIVGSADGTPPFFGRLRTHYADPRSYARGFVSGLGAALALTQGLSEAGGGSRFLALFAVGALAYGGIDFAFDIAKVYRGERRTIQTPRLYLLGILLGGLVAGALGWYLDAAQIGVVVSKFWAYADVSYDLSGRAVGDYIVYPLFNKYGAINLGDVRGGTRLFFSESLSGVINWSIAAPLFSINYVLLAALLERSLRPIKGLFSSKGLEGLFEQAVRVMRWGLWMAPVINSFLRQSPDPSWFNQDGAVRSLVTIGADFGLTNTDFRNFSLTMFLGLLAYDWLRIVIWFDHMGLRVATLVNLSFLGGDRADEAAGRYLGHGARTRAIPDGIRRFVTWAPLLIPFYIPRGPDWDKAWTGAETLRNSGGPMPGAIQAMAIAYGIAGAALALLALVIAARSRQRLGERGPELSGAPATLGEFPQTYSFNNGAVGVDVMRDGRGAAFVMGAERGGFAIDLTRRPIDPLQSRGQYFYISENDDAPWSIGFEPARRASDYSVEEIGHNGLAISNAVGGIAARMVVAPDPQGAVISWRIQLTNHTGNARQLRLVSFAEIAAHETGAYARDVDFAGMHVETFFVRELGAILARNRLLRSARAGRGETAFFAVKSLSPGANLIGYEDSRTRFIGEGSLAIPTGTGWARCRKLDDEGKLWTFDPAASLTLDVAIQANGTVDVEFIAGRADNAVWAADLIASRLDLAPIPLEALESRLYHTRAVEPSPALASRWPFAFAEHGRALRLTHKTPRPWAQVMANQTGASTIVSNDGDIYSAMGNARHNGLTPFRFDSVPNPLPGQIVYIRNLETGESDAPGFAPFQRDDATHELTFEPGVARIKKMRGDLAIDYCVFVPPDFPGDMRLLTLTNLGTKELRLRIAPFFDIALDESPNESKDRLRAENANGVLLFENPRNDFERGIAFAATSLGGAACETTRTRFFGGGGRNIKTPSMVETGAPDGSMADDGRRVAAFVSDVALAPGAEIKIAIVLGEAPTRAPALVAAASASVLAVENALAATRTDWAARLTKVQVATNRPDFDRLVNTWLPYQVMASRLFGRVGPNQRGGAIGFRDQLQDVLPLIFIESKLTRAQIVLHAGQQFLEGDVLKWWHRAPNGATGIGQRTKASDPHLWLPYVLARYVAQTGDATVLDDVTPYLEGAAVPEHEDTWIVAPRPSRETGDVYEHCQRAINYTLSHLGENGLPLLGAGDWNDGIDALGGQGRGTSVWMGFFFYDVLSGFIPLARARGDAAYAERCEAERRQLREALDVGWRGTHYALDFADDGSALDQPNAMTAGWPAWSGAVDFKRGLAAIEGGLAAIEREHRVLLMEKPFFEHSRPYPGRIADYPPGVRENGGQYSHGASWIIDGFVRLAEQARESGDADMAAHLIGRAFTIFEKISPLKKTDPERIAEYGLAPIQQPADIYDGYGHGGRGGWSWYTGSAARMLSAAYAIIGLTMRDGKILVSDDLFEPKGELKVERLSVGGHKWSRDSIVAKDEGSRAAEAPAA
jgi:cyclic beta-1,2-glucan synthetase